MINYREKRSIELHDWLSQAQKQEIRAVSSKRSLKGNFQLSQVSRYKKNERTSYLSRQQTSLPFISFIAKKILEKYKILNFSNKQKVMKEIFSRWNWRGSQRSKLLTSWNFFPNCCIKINGTKCTKNDVMNGLRE